jgi:hypothetical protein
MGRPRRLMGEGFERERAGRLKREQPLPEGSDGSNERWTFVELNKRPDHRVWCIPIYPPPQTVAMFGPQDALAMSSRISETAQFQVLEYRLDIAQPGGGTTVRWWGYEPVNEVHKPEVRRLLNRTAAYAERVRFVFDQVFGPRRKLEHGGPESYWQQLAQSYYPVPVETLREWVEVVIGDVEQALGKP